MERLRIAPYHPGANGCLERFHRTLNSLLGKVVDQSQRGWDKLLPHVLCAYNSTKHDTTGYSPNFLLLGRELRTPIDLVLTGIQDPPAWQSYDAFVADQQALIKRAYLLVRLHTQTCAERRKERYDLRVRESGYVVGSWVWRFYPRRYVGRSPKWQCYYSGPFLVVKVISPTNYILQKHARAPRVVVHVDQIKEYYGETPKSWIASGDVDSATVLSDTTPTSPTPLPRSKAKVNNTMNIDPVTPSGPKLRPRPLTVGEVHVTSSAVSGPRRGTRVRRAPRRFDC